MIYLTNDNLMLSHVDSNQYKVPQIKHDYCLNSQSDPILSLFRIEIFDQK